MAYEKQTWISYDDNKTEEQNIQDGAVVTAERMNHLETGLDEHDKNTTNPHKVNKDQVGLGNVTNVEQASKTEFNSHTSNKTNPHGVTKTQVGLSNVDNHGTATQVDAESGTATDKFMTPLRTKQHVSSRIASQTEAESGTATEKLMTPLRTKQHVDKRIATKAEAEAGTSETAIMSPLRTKEIVDTNQPFGVSISGGLMEGVNRVDGTTLTIGTIISYDNTHSKTNDLFNISSDQKTMTILRDCTLFFTGMFVSQTSSGSYYSVMRQFINGVNDLRLCGIAGTVNWRNDCGFSVTRSFKQGDKITFVLGTNYTNASAEAFGISQLHIQEVLPV